MALVQVVDGIGQTALAPVVDGGHRALGFHQSLELLDHCGDGLFAQRGVHDIDHFIVCVYLCHGSLHLLMDIWPAILVAGKDLPA